MTKDGKSGSHSNKGIKAGHYFLFDLDDGVIRSRLSKVGKEVEIKGQRFDPVKISELGFGAMISDRRVYNPGDSVRFLVACPGGGGKSAHLEVTFSGKRVITSDDFALDGYGLHLYELKGLEEAGEYTATVTTTSPSQKEKEEIHVEKKSFKCDFTVAQNTLSPLLVQIGKQVISGDVLDAELEATVLNQPYTGSITVGLYCDYCKQVVNQMSADVRNSSFKLKIALSGHTGPFRLEFSTPDGNTASISLQSTRVEERQEIKVGNLGEIVNVALIPIPDGKSIRGVNWARRGVATSPVVVRSVESEKIEVQATRNLDSIYVLTLNPVTNESYEKCKGPVKEGEVFSFRNSAPYQIIVVGCIVDAKEDKLFEGRTLVFYPEKLEVEVNAPKKAEPSDEVTITLESMNKTQCLLMVFDERLDTENIIGKLGKDIYSQLVLLGNIEELSNQFEVRREVFNGRPAEESVRVGTGPPMAMPSAPRPMMKMAAKMMAPLSQIASLTAAARVGSARSDTGALATVVTAGIPVQEATAPKRAWFPKLLACKLVEVVGTHEERVKLGDTITKWKVQVYAFAGLDYILKSATIEADSDVAVDLDTPSMIDKEDEYYGKAIYHIAQGKGTLSIKLPDGNHYEGEVEGNGIREFKVPGPGSIEAELTSPIGNDSIRKQIDPQVSEKVTVSTLHVLDTGDELDIGVGRKVFLYGSVKALLSDSVRSLIQYPYGCAEQTSAKLCGLSVAWEYGETTHEVSQMIDAGLSRMTNFLHEDGLYSLWEGGKDGSVDVTIKVLKNLANLSQIAKFKEKTTPLLEKPVAQLLSNGTKNNSLLPLNRQFKTKVSTIEDAASIMLYYKEDEAECKEALQLIENNAIEGSGGTEVHWEASQGTWGGSLESTATALRALSGSEEEEHHLLFRKGFKYLGKRLVGGRLYSTADTRALVELLASMSGLDRQPKFTYYTYTKDDPAMLVTKTEKDFKTSLSKRESTSLSLDDEAGSELNAQGRKLVAGSRFFIRTDGTEVIDYKKIKSNFNFEMKLDKTTLKLGERTKLLLTPTETSICPITKIFLPANTAFLEGGANIQTIAKPVVGSLTVDIVGTSRGRCKLYALLYDMYDSNKIGVPLPIEVSVK